MPMDDGNLNSCHEPRRALPRAGRGNPAGPTVSRITARVEGRASALDGTPHLNRDGGAPNAREKAAVKAAGEA
jgi:hypothetical protein